MKRLIIITSVVCFMAASGISSVIAQDTKQTKTETTATENTKSDKKKCCAKDCTKSCCAKKSSCSGK